MSIAMIMGAVSLAHVPIHVLQDTLASVLSQDALPSERVDAALQSVLVMEIVGQVSVVKLLRALHDAAHLQVARASLRAVTALLIVLMISSVSL